MATSTANTYRRAQTLFVEWCDANGASTPPSYKDIGRYLEHCVEARGVFSAATHLSALVDLYRSAGVLLDTKHPKIFKVMSAARERERQVQQGRQAHINRIRAASQSSAPTTV